MVRTWLAVLKLLLLVVIHHDVRLHGDELLLVKLPEVEQGQLVKLLIAEQHLHGGTTEIRRLQTTPVVNQCFV